MNYKRRCPSCGAWVKGKIHYLGKRQVMVLRQLVDFMEAQMSGTPVPCSLQKDLELTKNQYNNFQKLKHFGVVLRVPGGWIATKRGIDFIHGKAGVFDKMASFGNETVSTTHFAWKTLGTRPRLVKVLEVEPEAYKKCEDYLEDQL